jgi:hypothetical protein
MAAGPRFLTFLANEPRIYRELLAETLRALRPTVELVVLEPEALDAEVKRLTPQLVVCSRLTRAVRDLALAWVELYPEQKNLARVSVGGQHWTIEDLKLAHFLSIVDRTYCDAARLGEL